MPPPRAITCPLCHQQFFKASMKFHKAACEKKMAMREAPCGFCDRLYPMLDLARHMSKCRARPRDTVTVSAPFGGGAAPFSGDGVPKGAAEAVGEFTPATAAGGGSKKRTPRKGKSGRGASGGASAGAGAGAGAGAASAPLGTVSADGRTPCPTCGRKFAIDRLGTHHAICRKLKHRIPQVFDSSTQRAAMSGEDVVPVRPSAGPPSKRVGVLRPGQKFVSKPGSSKAVSKPGKAARWREQSSGLRQAMMAARRSAASSLSSTTGSLGRTMVAAIGTPPSPEEGDAAGFSSTMASTAMASTSDSRRVGFADTIKAVVQRSRDSEAAEAAAGVGAGVGAASPAAFAGSRKAARTDGPGGALTLAGTVRSMMAAKRWEKATAAAHGRRPRTAAPAVSASGDTSGAFGKRMAYASDYKLSAQSTSAAKGRPTTRSGGGGGSRPVSRGAARRHFSSTHKTSYRRPGTSHTPAKPSGRFNEVTRPSDGRVRSKVNHFEAGAGKYTYGGWEPDAPAKFGGTAERFVDTGRVHAGLYDGYTATEVARGLKPGKLISSNATSASNPLATSTYQVMPHVDARAAPKDWRSRPRTALGTSNATSLDNPLASSTHQVAPHPAMPATRRR